MGGERDLRLEESVCHCDHLEMGVGSERAKTFLKDGIKM